MFARLVARAVALADTCAHGDAGPVQRAHAGAERVSYSVAESGADVATDASTQLDADRVSGPFARSYAVSIVGPYAVSVSGPVALADVQTDNVAHSDARARVEIDQSAAPRDSRTSRDRRTA